MEVVWLGSLWRGVTVAGSSSSACMGDFEAALVCGGVEDLILGVWR